MKGESSDYECRAAELWVNGRPSVLGR